MKTTNFECFAGTCSIPAGIGGPLYSLAFVVLVIFGVNPSLGVLLSSLLLLLGAVLSVFILVALYYRLQQTDAAFALSALLLGLAGLAGSALHAGYDIANQINAPDASLANLGNLPSQVDPRGLATFGILGVALYIMVWLMGRSAQFSKGLVNLGYASAILMVVLYLGRLILLNPKNPIVFVVAALTGLVVNPAFYIGLGRVFRQGGQ